MSRFAAFIVLLLAGPGQDARTPVPSDEAQAKAVKTVREVFKDEYAVKTGTAQQKLARNLIAQGRETQDDPAVRFVLFREACDLAAQAGDADLLLRALDELSAEYRMTLASRESVLGKAEPTTTKPEDLKALTEAHFRLVGEALELDQFDVAAQSAQASMITARKSKEVAWAGRADALLKSVLETKAASEMARKAEQVLIGNPDDPAANAVWGEYLCLSKGRWEKGLTFLAKGPESALKALSRRELPMPSGVAERVAIADAWGDLAEKEKSPFRKSQMLGHAKTLYEGALPDATGLLRAKIEKRLGSDRQNGNPSSIDLLALIDVKLDTNASRWQCSGEALVAPVKSGALTTLRIPYVPPDEYELKCVISSPGGTGSIDLGLVGPGGALFSVVLDGFSAGNITGLHILDGHGADANETTCASKMFGDDKPKTVVCTITKGGVRISVDNRTIVSWRGEYSRLTFDHGAYASLKEKDRPSLFLAAWQAYRITRIELTPLSGQGKKLR